MDRETDRQIDRYIDRWMDGWMDGWDGMGWILRDPRLYATELW
jgi:hypothetical protein